MPFVGADISEENYQRTLRKIPQTNVFLVAQTKDITKNKGKKRNARIRNQISGSQ